MFDPAVPEVLVCLQRWFAGVITQPLLMDGTMRPLAPSGKPVREEAKGWIAQGHVLPPHQRIEIYNQQYWWRLLKIMRMTFPFVTKLLGVDDFHKQVAVPYLLCHPPDHWSLERLGDRLAAWAAREYREKDRELILDAIAIDWAFSSCEVMRTYPTPVVVSGEEEGLLDQTLYLQPTVHLFVLPYDLFLLRKKLVVEEDDSFQLPGWMQQGECVDHEYHFLFYRNEKYYLCWEEIGPVPFRILALFQRGCTVREVCEWLEKQEQISEEEMSSFPMWLRQWAAQGLFTVRRCP